MNGGSEPRRESAAATRPSDGVHESRAAARNRPVASAAERAVGAARRAQAGKLELGPRDRAIYYLMLGLLHLLSLIPDFLLYPLGAAGGWLGYQLDRRHVRIGMRNLEIAFPERSVAERRRILRASYVNLGRGAAEYIRLGGFFYRRLKQRVRYDGLDYWNELKARNADRGLLILSAHFGNFELLPTAHAMYGHKIGLVHHTQRFLAGDALLTFIRERAGVEVIRKHKAARAVLKALRKGEAVGIPFDQNAKRSEAVFVPFFSEMAATASGLARLVAISRAPVVPVYLVRDPSMRTHRIKVYEAVAVQHTDDAEADVIENTRRFMQALEAVVRQYPEQFLWTHRRYRTRPRGTPPIYDS